jgi:hypothetical protein
VRQIQDEQIQDVHQSCQVEVHQVEVHLAVSVVDVELHHLLRKDYFQVVVELDVVDVELRHLLRKDYCQDAVQQVLLE